MPSCPNGHPSQTTDWCDVCGEAMPSVADAGPAPGAPGGGSSLDLDGPVPGARTCEKCAAVNARDAVFCERCGHRLGAAPDTDAPETDAPPPPDPPRDPGGRPTEPARWVAEVWVDPEWYAEQDSDDACPSGGAPVVVPLRERSVLVGRRSKSRNITPEIDCGVDSGVSRRHAQLTNDGARWFVEDLQSANGTYVGPAGGPLPSDPLAPGQRRELADDERLYLGAWTRIVVRAATPEEATG